MPIKKPAGKVRLKKGTTNAIISYNIEAEMAAGMSQKRAVATALAFSGRPRSKAIPKKVAKK